MRMLRLQFGKWWVVSLQGMLLIILSMMIFNVRTGAIGISTLFGLQVLLAGLALVLLSLAKKLLVGAVTARRVSR